MLNRVNLLKWVDKYIGIPVCYLLSLFPQKQSNNKKVEKILVVKFWGMGSIVLATPALRLIKKKYPAARITFFTFSLNTEICKMYPQLIDEIISVNVGRGMSYFIYDFIFKIILINRSKYDMLFDFEFYTRISASISFLSRIPRTVGFHAWHVYRGDLHSVNVVFNRYWHVIDNFCNLVLLGNYKRNEEPPSLVPLEINKEDSNKLETGIEIKNKKIIVVNINAEVLGLERRWTAEYYKILLEKILEYRDVIIILIGGKTETAYVDSLYTFFTEENSVINLAGRTTLKELVLLLGSAFLFIGNDSGPLHLATALKTPTVSFFGPETPIIYGPIGSKHLIFYAGIDCSPCMNVETTKTIICYKKSPVCMESIMPEEAWSKIKEKYFTAMPLKAAAGSLII